MKLSKFWFEFETNNPGDFPMGIGYGCGVTAYNLDDAMSILNSKVFKLIKAPPIKQVIEEVDIQTLDQGTVITNMKSPVYRGVWFPLGYD